MKIQPVVIALIKKDGKYLLTRRVQFDPEDEQYKPYVWHVPGGGIEFGESPETAIKREIREELGVDVEIVTLIPKAFSDVRGKWQGIFLTYLCTMSDENSKITLNGESDQFGWFAKSDLSGLKILPHVDHIIEEADKIS